MVSGTAVALAGGCSTTFKPVHASHEVSASDGRRAPRQRRTRERRVRFDEVQRQPQQRW
jgi:hypothetical protein